MLRFLMLAVVILGGLHFGTQQVAAAPEGVPSDAVEATVFERIDGDKFKVRIGSEIHTVNLIGADAPEIPKGEFGECYAIESANYVTKLLPIGSTVWLEGDAKDKDGKDRLLRYAWLERTDGKKPFMLNQRLVQQGYASYKADDDNTKYGSRLADAEADAKEAGKGLWKNCEGPHAELKSQSDTELTLDYSFPGTGNSTSTVNITAGTYGVKAVCAEKMMNVYVNDLSGELVTWPISRSGVGDDSSNLAEIPADGDYELEVYCEGNWRLDFVRQ
jgi:micrococcal nuclease